MALRLTTRLTLQAASLLNLRTTWWSSMEVEIEADIEAAYDVEVEADVEMEFEDCYLRRGR